MRALICAVLALATQATYWPGLANDFISYDGNHYVTNNLRVRADLSPENLSWAFTTTYWAS